MSTPQRAASSDSSDNIRKRVCKACDRCRLKKSKCDGASPCSRCRADNAICVFGERKKSHDKVYPKGYVEMLEQQQAQLVAGMRELYRRLNTGEGWPGKVLPDASNGHPLTHDILERLDLLHMQTENQGMTDGFEEDTELMQRRLLDAGASLVRRRSSISSVSEHSHDPDTHSPLSYEAPTSARSSHFGDHFGDPFAAAAVARRGAPPTPPTPPSYASPAFARPPPPQSHQQHQHQHQQHHTVKPVGTTFPPAMQAGMSPAAGAMRQSWAAPAPVIVGDGDGMDFLTYESPIGYDPMMYSAFGGAHAGLSAAGGGGSNVAMPDWNDPIDMDFSNFIATTS